MPHPARLIAPGLLLTLAACVTPPPAVDTRPPDDRIQATNRTIVGVTAEDLATPTPAPAGSLAGLVVAPSGIVAAGGMNLVAAGGLNMVAAGGLNYRLPPARRKLLALTQELVVGAPVQLFNAKNEAVTEPVTTDKDGRYLVPKVPASGGPFIVRVGIKSAAGEGVLETIVRPDEGTTADVDVATTLTATAVVLRTKGKIETVRLREFKRAVSALSAVIDDASLPDLGKPSELAAAVTALTRTSAEFQNAVAVLAGEKAAPGATPTPAPTVGPGGTPVPGTSATPGTGGTPVPGTSASPTATPKPSPTPDPTPAPLTGPAAYNTTPLFVGGDQQGFVDGDATSARFKSVQGIGFDAAGNMYVADRGNFCIRRVAKDGRVTTVAGTKEQGEAVADALGSAARFKEPTDIAVASDGTAWVVDREAHLVRKLTPGTTEYRVTKHSGTGAQGFKEGAAADAIYDYPVAIAYDGKSTLFVADVKDSGSAARILSVDATTGEMKLYAGGDSKGTTDGPATTARFRKPSGLAVRWVGETREVWVTDETACNVRRIVEAPGQTPVVSTAAGPSGADALAEDGRNQGHRDTFPLSKALFFRPGRLAFMASGDLMVLDTAYSLIRWIRMSANEPVEIRTLAPASVATGGSTVPFKLDGMRGIAVQPQDQTLAVSQGDFARISTVR